MAYRNERDYSLLGADGRRAVERGLATAVWYASPVPRQQLKELMRRKDGPALRDTAIWLGLLLATGALAAWLWGSAWCLPAFAAYGVLYGSAADSRWHECSHGTAFRTRWLNEAVYQLACFMILREPVVWRWSHARHHTDTIVVGRDPEIAVPRPPDFAGLALNLFALKSGPRALFRLARHAWGRLDAEEQTFIPHSEQPKVVRGARVYLAVFAAVIAACVALHSPLPAMLVGLPSFYGNWLQHVWGLTQHAGLAEDVLDHRLNSRTVYMNPVLRFLYWNMNYHIEHHMYPMVPYHALPALHALIRGDCPPPYRGLRQAYAEILPALWRQRRDPGYAVIRPLPAATADANAAARASQPKEPA